jgi:hypothetical protein
MIRFAYCLTTKEVVGASTAAQLVRSGRVDLHEFVCADPPCQEKGVRVLLAAAESESVFPYYMTCTREVDCLKAMGYSPGVKLLADDAHVYGCQLYKSATSGINTKDDERTTTDDPTVLRPGAVLGIATSQSGQEEAPQNRTLATTSPVPNQRQRKKNGDLHDLVDAMRYWPEDYAQRSVIVSDVSRSVEDVFIHAAHLDDLSLGKNVISRHVSGGREDLTTTYHVYCGEARVFADARGFYGIRFDGGIDHSLAFSGGLTTPLTTQLVGFLNDAMVRRSARHRLYLRMLLNLGLSQPSAIRAFVFVLGRLKPFERGYLNIVPWQSVWDIVILPASDGKHFEPLLQYLEADRKETNRLRICENRRGEAEREGGERINRPVADRKGQVVSEDIEMRLRSTRFNTPSNQLPTLIQRGPASISGVVNSPRVGATETPASRTKPPGLPRTWLQRLARLFRA